MLEQRWVKQNTNMVTKNFKSASGYKKAQAYIHMNIHAGASKHPYTVKIGGKGHKVSHKK